MTELQEIGLKSPTVFGDLTLGIKVMEVTLSSFKSFLILKKSSTAAETSRPIMFYKIAIKPINPRSLLIRNREKIPNVIVVLTLWLALVDFNGLCCDLSYIGFISWLCLACSLVLVWVSILKIIGLGVYYHCLQETAKI